MNDPAHRNVTASQLPSALAGLLPALVLVATLGATAWLWNDARREAERELQTAFDFQVREAALRIRQRMAAYEQVLRGVQGLFAASRNVDSEEYRNYIAKLRLEEIYAGIQGVGYSPWIAALDKRRHIDAMRRQGDPDYAITPPGERDGYAPLIFLEPEAARHRHRMGFDPYADPERRVAMEAARDSGNATISGKVSPLEGVGGQAGVVMYVPVYRANQPLESLAERRAHLQGWISSVFLMDDLMAGILGEHATGLDIEIYDGLVMNGDTLLYDADSRHYSDHREARFRAVEHLPIGSRFWLMAVSSPVIDARLNHGKAQVIGWSGVIAAGLLAFLTWLLIRGRERAIRAAAALNQELVEREKVQARLALSEERWRFALEGAGDGVWDWNLQSGEVVFTSRWLEILGFDSSDFGTSANEWLNRVHPEDLPRMTEALAAFIEGQRGELQFEQRIRCKDQQWKWVLVRGMVAARDPEGKPVRLTGTLSDISERHRREEALRLGATVFDIVDEALMVTDPHNRIVAVNPAFSAITGYAADEVLGRDPRLLSAGTQPATELRAMWESLHGKGGWQGEIWNRKKNGEVYVVWQSIKLVHDAKGNLTHHVAVFSDISERKAREANILHQAHHDPLTDLPNRALFGERLQQALLRARREGMRMALMFLDLDNFKPVNDNLGHAIGDQLLKVVARRLLDNVRESDIVARIGGDEFVVLLPNVSDDGDVLPVSQKIIQVLEQPFEVTGYTLNISGSIGIALYPDHGEDEKTLIKHADIAMYHAKHGGRCQALFYRADMRENGK